MVKKNKKKFMGKFCIFFRKRNGQKGKMGGKGEIEKEGNKA